MREPFTPHLKSPLDAEFRRYSERPPELQPAIDAAEAFLLAVFVRRSFIGGIPPPYVAYARGVADKRSLYDV